MPWPEHSLSPWSRSLSGSRDHELYADRRTAAVSPGELGGTLVGVRPQSPEPRTRAARTLDAMDRNGIEHTGTARTAQEQRRLLRMDVNGLEIVLLSYTFGTNGIPPDAGRPWSVNLIDPATIRDDARRARARGADVALHWGDEYSHAPSDHQNTVAEQETEVVGNDEAMIAQFDRRLPARLAAKADARRAGTGPFCRGAALDRYGHPVTSTAKELKALAAIFATSGVIHLCKPEVYEPLMPQMLPAHREVIYASGVAELACAVGLLHPKTRVASGWVSFARQLAVYPANIKMAVDATRTGNTRSRPPRSVGCRCSCRCSGRPTAPRADAE